MNSRIRDFVAASAAVVAALAFAGPAGATGWHHNPPPPSTNCGSYGSIGDWKAVQGDYCIQGDKKYTLLETNLSSNTDISFTVSADGLTHTFKVTEDLYSGHDDKTYYIKFAVEVLDPNYLITSVGLDSEMDDNDVSDLTTVTKKIYQDGVLIDTLVSTEGTADTSIPLSASALIIKDYVYIPEKVEYETCDWVKKHGKWKKVCEEHVYKDKLDWFKNVFVQSPKPPTDVPEPGTLALFGAGLLGLGLLSRRRKA